MSILADIKDCLTSINNTLNDVFGSDPNDPTLYDKVCAISETSGDPDNPSPFDKQCEQLEKACLMDETINNCNTTANIISADENTVVLEGLLASQYPAGSTITLFSASGDVVGVAEVVAAEEGEDDGADITKVQIQNLQLAEGQVLASAVKARAAMARNATAMRKMVTPVAKEVKKAA